VVAVLGLWEAKRILEGEEEEEVEEGGEEVLYYHINGGRFKVRA
jgi:CO dehydrogenase/acetyl-CoA synthase gamma subunit (corrinoid Fe-S protein)